MISRLILLWLEKTRPWVLKHWRIRMLTRNTCFKSGITLGSIKKRKTLNSIKLNSFGITKSMCGISIISSWTLWTIVSIVVLTSSTSPRFRSSSTMEGWSEAHSSSDTKTDAGQPEQNKTTIKYSLRPKLFGLVRKTQLFRKTSLTALSL